MTRKMRIKIILFALIIILFALIIIFANYSFRFYLVDFVQYHNIEKFYEEREPKNNSDITILYSLKDTEYDYYITEKYTGEGEKDYILFIMDKFKIIGYYNFSFPQSPIFSTLYFNIGNKTIVFGDKKSIGWNRKSEQIKADLDMILLYSNGNKILSVDLPEKENIYFFIFNDLYSFDYVEVVSNGVVVSDSRDTILKKIKIIDVENY